MNIYQQLVGLLPQNPLMIATVTTVHTADGASTVTWPGGQQQRVRGTSVAAGHQAFVRAGVIEGAAPDLPLVVIEV